VYAIVDIETTGSHAASNGITEIAIVLHDGVRERGRYDTLVNPGLPIPPFIQSLTGITDAMVAGAPSFFEVAPRIHAMLQGRVFVAHNVNFDYSFVRHHLLAAGLALDEKKLCTVRLSRKVFPGLPRYSLGHLCRSLGIAVNGRHRAMGDAAATAALFGRLLVADTEGHLSAMLRPGSREAYLPLHLPAEQVAALPDTPGVYYFHDRKDKVVYVGKAVDIRARVVSHFSNNSTSRRKQEFMRQVHRVSCRPLGSDLVASVVESVEIRRLWPAFNRSQKRWDFPFGIYAYEDRRGIIRLAIDRRRKHLTPLVTVPSLLEGHALLRRHARQHALCPKCCWLQTDDDACIGRADGQCRGVCTGEEPAAIYNERVLEAIHRMREELPSFALLEAGRHEGEKTLLWVDRGEFRGWAHVDPDQGRAADREALEGLITPCHGNDLIRTLLLREAHANPAKVRWLA
jgi:DNA polymerase-3 subunit epsilon